MSTAAYLYPWDVAGDPAAPDLVAGLGLDHVVLAAAYHGVRARTPRHPAHRVVTIAHSARYLDAFPALAASLRAAGTPVRAWVVVNHVDQPQPGADHLVNAFGDVYPWALCPARSAVVARAVDLAAEVAALPDIGGVELEACGWFGFDHLSAHDKTGGGLAYPLSLCFCGACVARFAAAGIDVADLRRRVRDATDGTGSAGAAARDGGWAATVAALGEGLAARVAAVRAAVADDFRAAVVGEIRRVRPDLVVDLHASPDARHTGSFTGVDPTAAARLVDGLVVNCWHGLDAIVPASIPVHASLLAVSALGGRGDLAGQVAAARAAGATGVRLYHAGLADDADLAAVRALAR